MFSWDLDHSLHILVCQKTQDESQVLEQVPETNIHHQLSIRNLQFLFSKKLELKLGSVYLWFMSMVYFYKEAYNLCFFAKQKTCFQSPKSTKGIFCFWFGSETLLQALKVKANRSLFLRISLYLRNVFYNHSIMSARTKSMRKYDLILGHFFCHTMFLVS